MRVTVVDPSAYTPPYDHALCGALAGAGADVELVTSPFLYGSAPQAAGYRVTELFYRGSSRRYARRPAARGRFVAKLAEHPRDMARLRRHLAAEAPDVTHFQWLTVQPYDALALRRFRHPLVLTAHDVIPREPRAGQLKALRHLYGRFDALVVHSRHGRDRLVGELGLDPAAIHVIHHGAFEHLARLPADVAMDPAVGDLDGRPVVLLFGLLRPYKGVDLMIQALARVPGDAVLLVVGMPRMALGPLQELTYALGLTDRVRFVPRFVTDPEIPAYFRRADLVVLPYREIDQSGVLYTALAFGKPLVLTAVGGFTEFAAGTGAARLVPPAEPEPLAAAVAELLADPAERERLAQAAARAAAGPYSWSRIAEQTLALYAELAPAATARRRRS